MKRLSGEHTLGYYREDNQTYNFLYHFQLYKVERTTILDESDTVGWYLTAVVKEGNSP